MFQAIEYQFCLTNAEIDRVSEQITEKLEELETNKKDIVRIRLGIEEILLRFLEQSEGNPGVLHFCKKWGRPCLEIRVQGEKPDEKEDSTEFSDYSRRIMENMGLQPETFYKNGWNHIRLKLHKKAINPLIFLAAAVVLAVVVGLGSAAFFPQSTSVLSAVVTPLFKTFMGILTTIAGPMIFFSVIWGILCIGDAATLGTIGKKMMLRFILLLFVIATVTYIAGNFVFLPKYADAKLDFSQFKNIYQLILDIFPSSIAGPFHDNNTLQIIVIAIPLGIVTLVLQQKSKVVTDFVEQMNNIVQLLMKLITKLLPLFIFLSLTQLFLSGTIQQLTSCWKLLVMLVIVPAVVFAVILLITVRKYRVRLSVLIPKLLPAFLIAFTTASSAAAFSTSLECCETKLGIHQKLTRFGIPLGTVIYKPAATIGFVLICIYLAKAYQVSVSVSWVVVAILVSVVLTIAIPPIAGGGITCYAILFTQLGIPSEAIGIIAVVDILFDFYSTALNVVLLQIELLCQADSMKLLDRDMLKREIKPVQK